jgi:hypothetical protein
MPALFSRRRSSAAPPEKENEPAEPWDEAVKRARSNSRPIPPLTPLGATPHALLAVSPLALDPLSPLSALRSNAAERESDLNLRARLEALEAELAAVQKRAAAVRVERDMALAQSEESERRRMEAEDALAKEKEGREGEIAHHVKMALYRLEGQGVNLGVGRDELHESIRAAVFSPKPSEASSKGDGLPPTNPKAAPTKHATWPLDPSPSTTGRDRGHTLPGSILSVAAGDVSLFDPDLARRLSEAELQEVARRLSGKDEMFTDEVVDEPEADAAPVVPLHLSREALDLSSLDLDGIDLVYDVEVPDLSGEELREAIREAEREALNL